MNKNKKQKLAQHGWVETTVEGFLDLTPEESEYIELKLTLSRQLKAMRERHNLSQTALAKRIQSSQSRVAKMEKGDASVSIDLLVRSLLALDVKSEDIGRFLISPASIT